MSISGGMVPIYPTWPPATVTNKAGPVQLCNAPRQTTPHSIRSAVQSQRDVLPATYWSRSAHLNVRDKSGGYNHFLCHMTVVVMPSVPLSILEPKPGGTSYVLGLQEPSIDYIAGVRSE